MIILALDPSSTNVGYCLAEDATYILSGVFKPKGKADARVAAIVEWAAYYLTTYEPETVILEEPAANNAHRNPKTDRLLARVGGIIEAVALLNHIPVARVWPSQVKASGCSKDTRPFTARLVGKTKIGPDEADAVGVWQAYLTELQKQRFENL